MDCAMTWSVAGRGLSAWLLTCRGDQRRDHRPQALARVCLNKLNRWRITAARVYGDPMAVQA